MGEVLRIGFIGNPNCGKTTLFNAYTGANLKVANWPGVTVEKKEGAMKYHNHTFKLVDLPGIYSLTSYTMEETVSRNFLLSDEVDVIINVVDASALERNLYLTLQLIELGKPVILALNMMDVVEQRGMEIDLHRLPEMLGIPVIPVSARKKRGLDILMHTAAHHREQNNPEHLVHQHEATEKASRHRHDHHKEFTMVYSDEIEDLIDRVIEAFGKKYPELQNLRWHALKLLEGDTEVQNRYPLDLPWLSQKSYEKEMINQKYDFIQEIIEEVVVNRAQKEAATDRVDRLLTNRYLGIPIFLCVMALVFFLTFTIGDWLKGYFELGLDWFSGWVEDLLSQLSVADWLASLIVDGVIAGVGGILTFLPNIVILFLALAFLEDSGYLARVAYVMDGVMGALGLSGKAFIPMLLGFGCTVPAVMASRSLEDRRDRLRTMLVTPFMSCSARLPVYVLFSQMFFGKNAMLAAYSMYVLGIVVAIVCALIMRLGSRKQPINPLLMELPEYKTPDPHTVFIYVWGKVKDYLTKAGTVIFLASIVMWVLLSFGPSGMAAEMGDSFGAILGKALVPIFTPLGLGCWQIVVALIAGIAAKEVVVSSCTVLFGGEGAMLAALTALGFTGLNAYALMTFCLLYVPCAAAMGTIRRESGSWRYTIGAIFFQLAVAWLVTFFVYQIGSLIA